MNPCSLCSRRKFIGGLISSYAIASDWGSAPAYGETPAPPNLSEVLPIKISQYPALAQVGGSVQFTIDGEITKIYLIRSAGSVIVALDPTCPHAGCTVGKYNLTKNKTECPCHGSAFELNGSLINGPARSGLKSYPNRFSNGLLEVELPDFVFGISSTLPSRTSAGAARLAISFPTWKDATYQLRRATDLAGPFLPVLFSITPDGSLNLTALTGIGEPQTAYVDASGPRAFFRLELLISELSEPS